MTSPRPQTPDELMLWLAQRFPLDTESQLRDRFSTILAYDDALARQVHEWVWADLNRPRPTLVKSS